MSYRQQQENQEQQEYELLMENNHDEIRLDKGTSNRAIESTVKDEKPGIRRDEPAL